MNHAKEVGFGYLAYCRYIKSSRTWVFHGLICGSIVWRMNCYGNRIETYSYRKSTEREIYGEQLIGLIRGDSTNTFKFLIEKEFFMIDQMEWHSLLHYWYGTNRYCRNWLWNRIKWRGDCVERGWSKKEGKVIQIISRVLM